LYINDNFTATQAFYHGTTKELENTVYEPDYVGVNSLMIYTLSPGVTTWFRDLKLCQETCEGAENL